MNGVNFIQYGLPFSNDQDNIMRADGVGIVNWNSWEENDFQETIITKSKATEDLRAENPNVIYHLAFFAKEDCVLWLRNWEKNSNDTWDWRVIACAKL